MFHRPAELLRAVADASGCGWQGSLALLDLYSTIEFHLSNGDHPTLSYLATRARTKPERIKEKALVLQEMGWLTFDTIGHHGTYWKLKGIPAELADAEEQAHV